MGVLDKYEMLVNDLQLHQRKFPSELQRWFNVNNHFETKEAKLHKDQINV